MAESEDLTQPLIPQTNSIVNDLTTKMTEVLTRAQTSPQPLLVDSAPISIKWEGSNYALWSQIVEMYISGKDKLGYINGDFPQPPETDPSFRRWRTENAIVKEWLINLMDPSLIANFIRFQLQNRFAIPLLQLILMGHIRLKSMIIGVVLLV